MYKLHTHCRACGYGKAGAQGIKSAPADKLVEVFDLKRQPLANDFCREDEERAGCAPLKVLFCPNCSLAQLSVTVRPDILYRHYAYVTSPSETMRLHFKQLIENISDETSGRSVLEIGSNDGRLLATMQEKGYAVSGVDPAENLAEVARKSGIPTRTAFFGLRVARDMAPADIVIARHVFCHVDDWLDFVRGLESVSNENTVICIETPYAGNLLEHCEFDTIYHEHLSYLSLKAVRILLTNSNLHLHRILRYPIHGGAVLLMLRHNSSKIPPHASVAEFQEDITANTWRDFSVEATGQIERLQATVKTHASQGKRIAGLGASAKSTVWVNACGFTRKHIAFIADNTPGKQWRTSPGTDIPIVDEGAILRELPDYVVMFCWNYREEVLKKFALARSKGVRFLIPTPKLVSV